MTPTPKGPLPAISQADLDLVRRTMDWLDDVAPISDDVMVSTDGWHELSEDDLVPVALRELLNGYVGRRMMRSVGGEVLGDRHPDYVLALDHIAEALLRGPLRASGR